MHDAFSTRRRFGWLASVLLLLTLLAPTARAAPRRAPHAQHGHDTAAPKTASGKAAPKASAGAPKTASGKAAPSAGALGQTPPGVGPLPANPPASVRIPPTEAEKARGLPILAIRVTGNRRVSKQDVLTYLHERVGQPFKPETMTQDAHELWESGFFDDIQVDLDRRDQGVVLTFMVRERPNVSDVQFEGNDAISKDDLSGAIEVKPNTALSYPAVKRSVQKIRDMYAEKSYYLAEVHPEIVPEKDNQVLIRFKIKEHGQVTVRRITFIGNHSISSAKLRSVMFTGNPGFFAFGSGGPFRQDAFERDLAVISGLYYDRGFLGVQIATPRIMLTPDKKGIEVTITIDEGPRYKIRQLRIYEQGPNGEEVTPIGGRRNLRNMIRAKSGDWFNRAQLLEDLQAVRTMYRDHGYANVEANPRTRPDPKTHEVDVIVPIVRGPLVHFERIEVRGNTKTRDKVIRREMEVKEGDVFSETLLDKSRERITALGYFKRVDVSTEQGSAPDKIDVYVEVTERPTGTFQVGAGFSSIESFIATAQVQQANLFGNGQSLSLQAQVSGLRQLVDLRFLEPYFLNSEFSTSVDLYDQLRLYNDFSQSSVGGALTFGYPLIQPTLVASVTYTGEVDRVSTQTTSTFLGTSSAVSLFQRLPLANLFNDGFTSSVRPALTYDTRNNRLFPTSGIYLRLSSELASSLFGSHNEFLRNEFTGRFYYPLGAGFVIKLNTQAGLVTSPSSQGVPIFARFFLGGILDVRGFQFRSIGPRMPLTNNTDPNSAPIPNGANIGGNLEYYQNLELEFPIIEKVGIRGVIFTDAGNAWNLEQNYCATGGKSIPYKAINPCFDAASLLSLRTSYGFGIRWFSPLGPLRFEWGFPFSPLPYESSSDFEFTIGNFF